ncbi:hypothetical protein BPT24_147 [Tenacibaculum phage pT24]|uniref:Uncharacterized protein n=1 Tax=Tenacibaculum phage pT24 TaxID=1880590 RepID=A0A1B4XWT3_9CAUD|nr:hypothetical protein HYP10_gp147 [Tenacibaculum phage pT24]BAV39273.1 hypothetical protein BPT24_147 [Tenacibaculum phage pT24]
MNKDFEFNENNANFDSLIPKDITGHSIYEGGSLQGLSEYKEFGVEEQKTKIEKEAKDLVKSLLGVYFDVDLINNDDHLKAIQAVETSNLLGLLESARYAQHAVSTLMLKIDAGMHADIQIYSILIELQKSALDIQMKVAQYSRTLSPYLRSLKEDIEEAGNTTINVLSRVETDDVSKKLDGGIEGDSKQIGEKAFRGALAMNQYFKDMMEDIEESKKERKETNQAEMKQSEEKNTEYIDFEEISDEDEPDGYLDEEE